MSETRFTLRRPDPDPACRCRVLHSDHGTSALPAAARKKRPRQRGGEDPPTLVVLLPHSTHRRFKQLAAAQETTMFEPRLGGRGDKGEE